MITPARVAAYEVLLRVFEQDAYADRVFRTAARDLDDRERALAQRLAYGAVQRMRTCDYAIETLGKRPVRKLDAPVRASLRLGAYQLGYTGTAPHAAVNESVELVRRARLERAVPFTNAVMRRLAGGMPKLLEGLPDGPLKESYPDWIYETWVRELGADGALALMRAQNEPLETVVRLVSGPIPGEPTDVPGAYRVRHVDAHALAEGRVWPQSRASQLAGLVVGAQDGERILDLCAAPGGKTMQLRGDVTAVEIDAHRASELRETLERYRRDERHRRRGRRHGAAAGAHRLRSRARRCPLLGPRRPRRPARSALAQPAASRASARAAAQRGRARAARRDDRLLRLHDQRRRERGHRRRERTRAAAARRGVARIRASEAAGVPPHAASCPPDDRLLRRPAQGVASLATVGWQDWIRTVEIEPSIYAADFTRLGEQMDVLLRTGVRVFHFDVGDGHFVEPITMGPIVLQAIAPLAHAMDGVIDCHLMVDNPIRHFPQIAEAGGDSATFHYEAVDDVPATIAAAREHGLQVGVAFNPETKPEDVAKVAGDADIVLCMSIHPGYSGQEFMEEAVGRIERLRAALPESVYIQVDGGIDNENVRSVYDAGARLIVAGAAIFHREDLPRSYRRLVQALA